MKIYISTIFFAFCLFFTACKNKQPHWEFSYPVGNETYGSIAINYNAIKDHHILGKLKADNVDIEDNSFKQLLLQYKQEYKLPPSDSILPMYWSSTSKNTYLPESYDYSFHWGEVSGFDGGVAHEDTDTLIDKSKNVEYVTRWKAYARADVFLPKRGMHIYINIPFCFHYNPFKKKFEYFLSKAEGNNCTINFSAPFIGDITYSNHYFNLMEAFADDKDVINGYAPEFSNGFVWINERRWYYKFENGKDRFIYPLNSLDIDFQKSVANKNKSIQKSSELYQIEFEFLIKDPAITDATNTILNSYPSYFIVTKVRSMGIPFN